ncbi:MAG: AAA family ATPase [Candidatus Thiodiazotropha sp.]
MSRHALSYLNGGGGSDKTTRAIELFRQREPLVFTPTHRLVKEMRARGVQAQTYHSFFRWSGHTEWMPERMGQKFVPHVIIRDEVCTVPCPILETFLDWLDNRSVQVICCGDQGNRPRLRVRCHTTGSVSVVSPQTITMKRSRWTTERRILPSKLSKSESACRPTRSNAEKRRRCFLAASGGSAS